MLEEIITCNGLWELINELLEIKQEEDENEQDKLLWHFWLQNVEGKSFVQWKSENTKPEKTEEMQVEEMEATIKESRHILDGFMPS